jgi:hypothetical protein
VETRTVAGPISINAVLGPPGRIGALGASKHGWFAPNGHGRAAFAVTHNTPIIEDVVVCFPLQNGFQYYSLGA